MDRTIKDAEIHSQKKGNLKIILANDVLLLVQMEGSVRYTWHHHHPHHHHHDHHYHHHHQLSVLFRHPQRWSNSRIHEITSSRFYCQKQGYKPRWHISNLGSNEPKSWMLHRPNMGISQICRPLGFSSIQQVCRFSAPSERVSHVPLLPHTFPPTPPHHPIPCPTPSPLAESHARARKRKQIKVHSFIYIYTHYDSLCICIYI